MEIYKVVIKYQQASRPHLIEIITVTVQGRQVVNNLIITLQKFVCPDVRWIFICLIYVLNLYTDQNFISYTTGRE